MAKQKGTLILVVLLLLLLVGWWSMPTKISPPTQSGSVASLALNPAYTGSPITLHHSVRAGEHTYTGELMIRDCDSFSTAIQGSGIDPVHIFLTFVVTRPADCAAPAVSGAPFSTSFSSNNSKTKPVLDAIIVDQVSALFSIVEDK